MRRQLSFLLPVLTFLSSSLPAHADEFQPWINRSVLATDHQAYCNDVIGQQVQNDNGMYRQNDIGAQAFASSRQQQQQNSTNSQVGGGGGIGLGPIKLNGNGHSNNASSNRTAFSSSSQFNQNWDNSYQVASNHDSIRSESVGKNCSDFVKSGAFVEATQINAETQRMGIQSQESMFMFQGLLSPPRN
jgi:hypothetical protein